MLLRASGERDATEYDLNAVTSDTADAGVPHSDLLRKLTEATVRNQWGDLPAIRDQAIEVMGLQPTIDALTVAAAFNGITRVADSTGIPLDDNTQATTGAMREATGIQSFDYAQKSARYDLSA